MGYNDDSYFTSNTTNTNTWSPLNITTETNAIRLGSQVLTEDMLRRLSELSVTNKYDQYIKKEVKVIESDDERFERVVKEAAQKMKL